MERREQSVLTWIVELGEARLLQFAEELLSNPTIIPKMTEAISTALHSAARTKGQVDRNLQGLLALLGVPTKADYNKLLSKIEALQGSLVNLNIKLDRLMAVRVVSKRARAAPRRAKRRAAPRRPSAGTSPDSSPGLSPGAPSGVTRSHRESPARVDPANRANRADPADRLDYDFGERDEPR